MLREPGTYPRDMSQGSPGVGKGQAHFIVASHEGVFRGTRISSLPTNACSTENTFFSYCFSRVVSDQF